MLVNDNAVVHVSSFAFSGINVIDVDIQIHMSNGIPSFTIVGLADKTVAESKERVYAALSSLGLGIPAKKILINLAPADLIKEGSHFDLPIACSILSSFGILPRDEIADYFVLGELALDGSILPINGVLPAAIGALAKYKGIICPFMNGKEAAWSNNNKIIAPSRLIELINHFKGSSVLITPQTDIIPDEVLYPDLSEVVDQEIAKRAIEIAASGAHNMLMIGPPGSGKSMIASRLPGILPAMTAEEILECSMIASISGLINDGKLISQRPFRSPHHSCSVAAMVGGGMGRRIKPGEISLAHNGVLFLDELPEFNSNVIESLRQPLETGEILISRASNYMRYPANFQLIAAMNPCKCGYFGTPEKSCYRAPQCASDYQRKISGPIIDRFDMHIEVSNINVCKVYGKNKNSERESSKTILKRVEEVRKIQIERYKDHGILYNSKLDGKLLSTYAIPRDHKVLDLLNDAAEKFSISMRAYNRILRIARTIADMDRSTEICIPHLSEALNYRKFNYGFTR